MIALPQLGLGAANLGNLHRAMDDDTAFAILDAAWDAGVRHFDTAPHYGLGLSERRLGAYLATKPRAEFLISTKAGRTLRPVAQHGGALDDEGFVVTADARRVWEPGRDAIRRGLDESLSRLGLDRVDILYLHDPERYDLDSAEREAYPALCELRDEGVVAAVGLGSMSTDALERATRSTGLDLLMVAGRLTLVDDSARDVVAVAARAGMRVVAAGVFNSGLLATPQVPDDARFEYDVASPAIIARARAIAAVCVRHGVDLPTVALHHPLRSRGVSTVVIGASRPSHVAAAVGRIETPVPDELWVELAVSGLVPHPN